MTRTSLNWAISLTVLAFAMACGSSGNQAGVNGGPSANVGGTSNTSLGGDGSSAGNAGTSGVSGNGTNGGQGSGNGGTANAGNGNGTAGDNTNAGTGAISGNGGADNGGSGDNPNGGSGNEPSSSTGGEGSQDIHTGGSTSQDVGTGGGNSLDGATGGASSQDIPTGGASSQDIPTGGASSQDIPTGGATSQDIPTGGAPSYDVLNCTKTTLTEINVYVTIDATPTGADTEGNMYVGGNLTSSGSYTVGAKDTLDCNRYSLVVGGNISIAGGSINGGKSAYGGTSASVSSVSFACGGLTRGKPVDFALLKAQVETLSTKLSQLPSNGTVSKDGSGALVLTGTDKTLNVFNIDASQLGAVNVNFPAGSAVVVNVSGTTANWTGASVCLNGQCSDSDQATNVVWNFYEATSVSASGIAIEGSVLAPFATLDGGGGHIAGQVIVRYLKGGLEYHPYYFDGCITWPTSV